MYAVIETGGKQYRVELGSEIEVPKLDVAAGGTIELDRVLLVADGDAPEIGRPLVEGALVTASVVRQDRGEKIVVFKYRPKARHRSKQGHRQDFTLLRIADIRVGDRSAASAAEAERADLARAQQAAAEEARRQALADQALAERLAREADSESGTDAGSQVRTRGTRVTKGAADEVAARSARTPRLGGARRTSRSPASRTQAPPPETPEQTPPARPEGE